MPSIKVRIDKFIRDDQPGFVECSFTDAWGTRHIMQDKVPIFTAKDLGANSIYPQEGIVACEIVKKWKDKEGRLIFTGKSDDLFNAAFGAVTIVFIFMVIWCYFKLIMIKIHMGVD